jgi:hypothetical protein
MRVGRWSAVLLIFSAMFAAGCRQQQPYSTSNDPGFFEDVPGAPRVLDGGVTTAIEGEAGPCSKIGDVKSDDIYRPGFFGASREVYQCTCDAPEQTWFCCDFFGPTSWSPTGCQWAGDAEGSRCCPDEQCTTPDANGCSCELSLSEGIHRWRCEPPDGGIVDGGAGD